MSNLAFQTRLLWALSGFVAIGPLWLAPRDLWDGVIGSHAVATGDFSGFGAWLHDSSWYLLDALYRAIHYAGNALALPHWVLIKGLISASLLLMAREAHLFARDVLRFQPLVLCWVGPIFLACPAWANLYSGIFILIFFMWAGLAGHRLIHATSGPQRSVRVALGIVLIAISFQVNSNFVLLLGLEAARWLLRSRRVTWNWKRTIGLTCCCVLVYAFLRLQFRPVGAYADYNDLLLPISRSNIMALLISVVMFGTWIPLLSVAPLTCLVLTRWPRVASSPGGASADEPNSGEMRQVLATVLLVSATILPYVAVGKGTALFFYNPFPIDIPFRSAVSFLSSKDFLYLGDSWSSRHLFVSIFSLTLLIPSLVLWAASRPGWRAASHVRSMVVTLALATGCAALMGCQMYTHILKLQRLAMEQSLLNYLRTEAPPPPGMVDFEISPPSRWLYPVYDSNYWLWLAYRKNVWASVVYYPNAASRQLMYGQRADVLPRGLPSDARVLAAALMKDYVATGECTTYRVSLERPKGIAPLLLAGYWPDLIPAAQVQKLTSCGLG